MMEQFYIARTLLYISSQRYTIEFVIVKNKPILIKLICRITIKEEFTHAVTFLPYHVSGLFSMCGLLCHCSHGLFKFILICLFTLVACPKAMEHSRLLVVFSQGLKNFSNVAQV